VSELINEEARRYFEEVVVPIAEIPAQRILETFEGKFLSHESQFDAIQEAIRNLVSNTQAKHDDLAVEITDHFDTEIQRASNGIIRNLGDAQRAFENMESQVITELSRVEREISNVIRISLGDLENSVSRQFKRIYLSLAGLLILGVFEAFWMIWKTSQ